MTAVRLLRILPVLVLCGASAMPAASAERPVSGNLVARSLEFSDAAQQTGQMLFFHVTQSSASIDGQSASLAFAGAHVDGRQYHDEGYEETTAVPFSTLYATDSVTGPQYDPFKVDHATGQLSGMQASYNLNIFADRAIPFRASIPQGQQTVLAHPELDVGSIKESPSASGPVPNAPSNSPQGPYWTIRDAESAHVLTEALGAATLHLEGTFTVEVIGFDFELKGDGSERHLHSGIQRDAPAPGVPAHRVQQDFLRIQVTDGSLDLGVTGIVAGLAGPRIQWSGPSTDSSTGAVGLAGATGSLLRTDGQQQQLTGATYRLEGRYDLVANPAEQGLQLGVTGLDDRGQPLAPALTVPHQEASTLAWLIALAAVALAAGTSVAVVLLRRQPTMADLEAGLETGHFRRVVRDAGRILRKRPGFEDAVISRSIALSKMGRNGRVVREVRAHFAAREPSDGVLHYVLGLALKELGETAQAQEAWREAVRRTPGLLPQVAPLLPQASSTASPVPPLVDGNGYA